MYDKKLLAKSTGASLGVVAIIGLVFLSTGTAFALPISGIGGFLIQADRIEGDDLLLYPGLADGSERENYPHAIVEIRDQEIEGLRLSKTFDLSDYTGVVDGRARLVIESDGDPVTINQLFLKTPELNADEAQFSGLEISENDSGDFEESFSIEAPSDMPETRSLDFEETDDPGIVLDDAEIRATYLTTDEITLPNLALSFQLDTDDDGEYEYS
jgi:hypothetical protein